MKALSWEECKEKIRNLISDLYGEYKFITEKMDEIDKKYFYKIRSKEKDESYENSLKNLTRYLYEYYSQKVVILIDEYDTPLISAYENNFYKESINFFKTFYGSVLKSNIYLQTEVMTGILRVAKEWIFSDLNNITVYTVLDKEYSSYFGLTEKEVIEATHEYNVRDNIEQIKKWYDGYNFGGVEIYNPWSILNYLSRKRLDSYWVNTSNDYLIIDLFKNSNMDLFEDLKKVFYNGVTEQIIDIFSNMDNLKNSQEIWQLMLYSGYLTVEEKIDEITFKLRLPNYEVRTFFERAFMKKNFQNEGLFRKMIKSLLMEDIKSYENLLQEILLISMSYYDGSKEEKFYPNLILGMILSLDSDYIILSNSETGYGRSGMALEPKDRKKQGYIFEFKTAENEKMLGDKVKEALEQIENKNYIVNMKNKGIKKIIKLGVAFYGKKVKVGVEKD